MEEHTKSVNKIASVVQGFFERGESYRISHGSTNSTRPRNGAKARVVEIGMLSNVVSVDREARTALVEPNVPMDRLVEATMRYNLVPPVVMEFPGITAGGGFAGTSGESSSFRHGFFNDTINYVEMILGNGEIVKASRTERADLFHGAAGAAGTLGVTTLMELRLVEAQKYVKCTYYRTKSVAEGIKRIEENTKDSKLDYIDGILYSKDHGVIITGQLTDEKPEEQPLQRFSDASDPWFYMHVQEKTKDMSLCSSTTEYIPLGEYLFRYDRAGFWVGRHGYTYFKYIPFNGFFRWLLDDFSHTRMLYHALHASGISSRFVVQDLGLPYDTAEAFIDHVADDLHIWPLWLCPLKETSTPTFHPSTAETDKPLIDVSGESGTPSQTMSRPMLNIGVWGWGPQNHDEFIKKNRDLETKLTQLGGRKWLYAHTYYSEEEFWNVYNKPWYQALREKYNATTLPTIYDKVKVRAPSSKGWTRDFANKWPIGGLYGMWVALLSGDYAHHRNAGWKYSFDQEFKKDPEFQPFQIRAEIANSLTTLFWLNPPTIPIFVLQVRGYSKLYNSGAASWWYEVAQYPLFVLFTDTAVYWMHRLFYTPFLFKTMHRSHHQYVIPTPFSAYAFHPLEAYIISLPVYVYSFLWPMSKPAQLVVFVQTNILGFLLHDNGDQFHTVHHNNMNLNFSLYLELWDY